VFEEEDSMLPTKLKPTLNSRIMGYVAAASGAALAIVPASAQGEIVFSAVDVTTGGSYALDLNKDGTPDFTFEQVPYDSGHGHDFGLALDVPGNAVLGARNPLPIGARIGPGRGFTTSTYYGVVFMGENFEYGTITNSFGFWKGVTNKFVGFKFLVSGEVHYGWARLSGNGGTSVVISGYAYETVPNKGIRAGQRTEDEVLSQVSSPELSEPTPPTLGLMAAGTRGLAVWRREQ
jgi:hypothetical protein